MAELFYVSDFVDTMVTIADYLGIMWVYNETILDAANVWYICSSAYSYDIAAEKSGFCGAYPKISYLMITK